MAKRKPTRPGPAKLQAPFRADVNAVAGGLLRDLAFVQESKQKTFGYKRAADAVLALDRPLSALLGADGTLGKIPGIGPASTRVILEVLETGASETVERAVSSSAPGIRHSTPARTAHALSQPRRRPRSAR